MARQIDRESSTALIKLIIFCTITGVCTVVLGMTLSNGGFAKRDQYKAMFTDVTGVAVGDEVRIAGVRVGTVKGTDIVGRDKAVVEFGIDPDITLNQNTIATLRFRNLVGQRYLALSQGSEGATTRIEPGATIPLSRTKPALDLDLLLQGFKPVFQALNPTDINKLAYEIVKTLQGESGNVESLLGSVSSLTQTLAGRDQLIGDVIKNLSKTLDMLGSRDAELSTTISTLREFIGGLNDDRDDILNSLDDVSLLTTETADLLGDAQQPLAADLKQLNRVTSILSTDKNLAQLEKTVQLLPIKLHKVGQWNTTGSLTNFYLCELNVSASALADSPIGPILSAALAPLINGVAVGGTRCDVAEGEWIH
jgi:phospholipid/cholesterol/gamma-HCH transport system substrate-binding protein